MSEPTADDLRRQALLESLPTGTAPAGPPRNPYLVGLVVITVVIGSIAGILYLVAASSYDTLTRDQLLPVANTWCLVALAALLVTLILGGLTWKPAPAEDSRSL